MVIVRATAFVGKGKRISGDFIIQFDIVFESVWTRSKRLAILLENRYYQTPQFYYVSWAGDNPPGPYASIGTATTKTANEGKTWRIEAIGNIIKLFFDGQEVAQGPKGEDEVYLGLHGDHQSVCHISNFVVWRLQTNSNFK